MTEKWRQYQEDVASVFQSLGLSASIETEIKGARARHRIDVLVRLSHLGFDLLWVVECKYWQSRVPKEKVLALHQIAQDVGADRAFLFSEQGFQAGAVSAAKNTNITLTSLEELHEAATFEVARSQIDASISKLIELDHRAKAASSDYESNLRPMHGVDFDEVLYISGCCMFLERAATRARFGDVPASMIEVATDKAVNIADVPTFAARLSDQVASLNVRVGAVEAARQLSDEKFSQDAAAFVEAVRHLDNISEQSLISNLSSDQPLEDLRHECLIAMKEVGRRANTLRSRGTSPVQEQLHAVMRLLIDTVYLDLTKPSVPPDAWRETIKAIELQLSRFEIATCDHRHTPDQTNNDEE